MGFPEGDQPGTEDPGHSSTCKLSLSASGTCALAWGMREELPRGAVPKQPVADGPGWCSRLMAGAQATWPVVSLSHSSFGSHREALPRVDSG